MNRDRQTGLTAVFIIIDIVLTGLSFIVAYYEKISLPGVLASLGHVTEYGWLFLVYLGFLLAALYFSGFYTFTRTQRIPDIILGVARSAGIAFGSLILILFLIKQQDISRLFLLLFCINNALILIIEKVLLRYVMSRMQEHGHEVINALVIGSEYPARRLIEQFNQQSDLGYRVLGCLDPEEDRVGNNVAGVEVIGTTDGFEGYLEQMTVDEVFVAMPVDKIKGMNKIMYICEEMGVRFSLLADWFKPHIAKTVVRNFLDRPVITFTATPTAVGQLFLKAVTDRIAAAVLVILLAPLYFLIAVAIKVSSPGPVFFKQIRAGLNGRPFNMLKFRTMVVGAEDMLDELKDQNEMDGPVFKIKKDPRVTWIGRILRKTSLDELPQIINVLKGEMSLVGPRPPVPEEVEKYERWQRRRLSMKPGITCFWQISGRNEVKFDDWMALDLKYIDNWTYWLDIIILLKTIPVVLSGRGAS